MSLINLPPTRHRGRRHHLSDNEGDEKADDTDVGEDSVSNNADNANDADKEDHSYITLPPSDNDDDHNHNSNKDDNEDKDDDKSYNSYNQEKILLSTIVIII